LLSRLVCSRAYRLACRCRGRHVTAKWQGSVYLCGASSTLCPWGACDRCTLSEAIHNRNWTLSVIRATIDINRQVAGSLLVSILMRLIEERFKDISGSCQTRRNI